MADTESTAPPPSSAARGAGGTTTGEARPAGNPSPYRSIWDSLSEETKAGLTEDQRSAIQEADSTARATASKVGIVEDSK